MKKIHYSGFNAAGDKQSGFVVAPPRHDALDRGRNQGLQRVELHDDARQSAARSGLARLGPEELAALARFERQLHQPPTSATLLYAMMQQARLPLALGGALSGWGFYAATPWLWLGGIGVAAALPAWALINYRTTRRYDALLRASALGQHARVRQLVAKLQTQLTEPLRAFDLALRTTCARQTSESLDSALDSLAPWKPAIDELAAGRFEAQMARVFHAHGKYQGYLQQLRAACRESADSPALCVDLALAEARFGELERAEALLASTTEEALPPQSQPLIHWSRGLIAQRRGDPSAAALLRRALAGLVINSQDPARWPDLALCVGHYLSALDPERDAALAARLLGIFGGILRQHGDKALLQRLHARYPQVAVKELSVKDQVCETP